MIIRALTIALLLLAQPIHAKNCPNACRPLHKVLIADCRASGTHTCDPIALTAEQRHFQYFSQNCPHPVDCIKAIGLDGTVQDYCTKNIKDCTLPAPPCVP